jgi:hypothetical protein
MKYHHTQTGPIWLLLLVLGIAAGASAALLLNNDPVIAAVVGGLSLLFLFLAMCFRSLTVVDEGDFLTVRFGPIPLFRKRIPYDRISNVEPARSSLIDGWGVHFIPGRGWTWNLWGWNCVRLTIDGGTLRVGTDDSERLADVIRSRIKPAAARQG